MWLGGWPGEFKGKGVNMAHSVARWLAVFLLVAGFSLEARSGEVVIYTGTTQWITKPLADAQAQICVDKLNAAGVLNTWYQSDADMPTLAEWMQGVTNNGETDVCILYGDTPPDIYPQGNAEPDGSIVETYLESTDGDVVINHADWMFWGLNDRNNVGGLQNIMDDPGITLGYDNTPMVVTDQGKQITPSMKDFLSDRPFPLAQLNGEWVPEVILAQNADGSLMDPVIVRDGPRGRLIPMFQAADQNDPKGACAAEVIFYLFGISMPPSQLGISGTTVGMSKKPMRLTLQLQDKTGSPRPPTADLTVNLTSDSAGGKFDTDAAGPFNGSITSVVIPTGSTSATIFYEEPAGNDAVVITAKATGFTDASITLKVFDEVPYLPGEVVIYTGVTQWITKALADIQAQKCTAKLSLGGIASTWYQNESDTPTLAEWMQAVTNNGQRDVCVLYGDTPPDIYPQGNAMPDGSILETYLESTDGDAIINHADYMFWGLNSGGNGRNDVFGLQNIMDIPGITMWDDNTPVVVTEDGSKISPTLKDFASDRPFHLDELANDWFPEVILAQNAAGTRSDPTIVRDGNRGRLINCYQTADEDDPKGAVAAEIIFWIYGKSFDTPTQLGLSSRGSTPVNHPLAVTVELQDATGSPKVAGGPTVVDLGRDKITLAFDLAPDGPFNKTFNQVTIPAGSSSLTFYAKDTKAESPKITARTGALTQATLQLNVFSITPVPAGEVAIYTGATQWIAKPLADAQAQICVDQLNAASIANTWFQNDFESVDLAGWMVGVTDNGQQDVCVLYGDTPPDIYPVGNAEPDGSILEAFVESTDGDTVINHADWMFWGLNNRNGAGGLQNVMDLPGITLGDDNDPMIATDLGKQIAPDMVDFTGYRTFALSDLGGDWWPEAILAQNAAGTRVDPGIFRDGPRGRLVPCFQTPDGGEPQGAVGAEIIIWLMSQTSGHPPLTPTGLVATASNGQVALDWSDNTEADLTGYNIFRSDAGGPFTKLNAALLTASEYTDIGLTNGVEYCYKVQAANGIGVSAQTAAVCATPSTGGGGGNIRRGDVDGTGVVELTDVINLLGFLFLGNPANLDCFDAADVDDTGVVELTDAIVELGWLFLGNPTDLPAPGPLACGPDPTADDLAACNRACQ